MNTVKIAATVIATAAVTAGVVHFDRMMVQDVAERFPMFDKKLMKKAYRKYLLNSLTGKYAHLDLDNYTDEQMDELFLDVVFKIDPWARVAPYND